MDWEEIVRWAAHYGVIWIALAIAWVVGMQFFNSPSVLGGWNHLVILANSIVSIIVLVVIDQLADKFILGEK